MTSSLHEAQRCPCAPWVFYLCVASGVPVNHVPNAWGPLSAPHSSAGPARRAPRTRRRRLGRPRPGPVPPLPPGGARSRAQPGAGRGRCSRSGRGARRVRGRAAVPRPPPAPAPPRPPPRPHQVRRRRRLPSAAPARGGGRPPGVSCRGVPGNEGGVRLPRCPTRCSVASDPGAEPRLRVGPSWRYGDRSQADPVPGPRLACAGTRSASARGPLAAAPPRPPLRQPSAPSEPKRGWAGLGSSRLFGNSLSHK